MNVAEKYEPFKDSTVVVDVKAPLVYLGRLVEADSYFMRLTDVDVHEINPSSSKEVYIMDAAKHGVHPCRKEVRLKMEEVISISLLDDVIVY